MSSIGPTHGEGTAHRLFIAIAVPAAVKDEFEKAQGELRGAVPGKTVRWTRREQFHLTLRFLGAVEAGRVDQIIGSLRRVCRGFSPMRLRAQRIGFFPDSRPPRVIWAGVNEGGNDLRELQRAIESGVQEFTREEAEARFVGHVTLGRCQKLRRTEAEQLAALARSMSERVFGEWIIDAIELIRSELSPAGSRYTTVADISLGSRHE